MMYTINQKNENWIWLTSGSSSLIATLYEIRIKRWREVKWKHHGIHLSFHSFLPGFSWISVRLHDEICENYGRKQGYGGVKWDVSLQYPSTSSKQNLNLFSDHSGNSQSSSQYLLSLPTKLEWNRTDESWIVSHIWDACTYMCPAWLVCRCMLVMDRSLHNHHLWSVVRIWQCVQLLQEIFRGVRMQLNRKFALAHLCVGTLIRGNRGIWREILPF